jgi:hypothetical protein
VENSAIAGAEKAAYPKHANAGKQINSVINTATKVMATIPFVAIVCQLQEGMQETKNHTLC